MRETVVYKKILKDPWALLSAIYIFCMVLMAIFAYQIAPDNTSNANQMHLSIHSKPPGFKVKVLVLKSNYYPSNKRSFFSGEINKTLEIPIQDYKIRSDGAEIQPYGSTTDYFEFIEASKLQSPLTEPSFKKQHLKEKKFLLWVWLIRIQ